MKYLLASLLAAATVNFPLATFGQDVQEGLVETRILDMDPQAGVKSHHFYYVDFPRKVVSGSFTTGSTKIDLGVISFEVSSIRDNFSVENVVFNGDSVSFNMVGTTASGIMALPDIDYRLSFTVNRDGSAVVGGCHDAYPAYIIQHNGETIYRFEHQSLDLIKLFGTCDQSVAVGK